MKSAAYRIIAVFLAFYVLLSQIVYAAPAINANGLRIGYYPDKIRLVIDVDKLPEYQDVSEGNFITVTLNNAVYAKGKEIIRFNDYIVDSAVFSQNSQSRSLELKIQLKRQTEYRIFTLKNPNRIVIDIIKKDEYKTIYNIAEGITYTDYFLITKSGPVAANVVKVDAMAGYKLMPALSNGEIRGLDTLKNIVRQENAVVGINASYFNADGSIIGLLKMNGEFVSMPDIQRSAVGMMPDGSLIFGAPAYSAKVQLPDSSTINIDAINYERGPNGCVVYNKYFGSSTLTNDYGDEYIVVDGKVVQINLNKGNSIIPEDGFVLSAHGDARAVLSKLKQGQRVEIKHNITQPWDKAVHILGAGPMLVKNGKIFLTTQQEEFLPDIAYGRAPRSAVAMAKDGSIILVVVDGRSSDSIGMTLYELADFMVKQGALYAINLDGGGSSEMVINGNIVNNPSDGNERRLGSALVICK